MIKVIKLADFFTEVEKTTSIPNSQPFNKIYIGTIDFNLDSLFLFLFLHIYKFKYYIYYIKRLPYKNASFF